MGNRGEPSLLPFAVGWPQHGTGPIVKGMSTPSEPRALLHALALLRGALGGRYAIARELGAGGMATVYLARDVKHDRDVALKVLRPELAAVLGAERFLQEIRISARLDHPHILTLIDSGESDGFVWYVLPYVRGESLRAKLTREKQLALAEAVRIATQVASALDYAHRHGVIHRDIKPENILLHEGEAVVADFGIALAVREAGGPRLTESGLSLGTPQYMSPEQATGGQELDARSDVYSLAAVVYEMLAGEPPHTGPTVQAVIAKLLTERPTRIRTVRDTVPEGIDTAVAKALAKVPADRFASAYEFTGALQAAAEAPPGAIAGQAPATREAETFRESGRKAFARHAWREAFEALSKADAAQALSVEDVERLAETAWWIGRIDGCIAARERAYTAYIDQGNPRRAAVVAVRLAEDFFRRQAKSVGNGWLKRAERLLQDLPECPEHAVLLRAHAVLAFEGEANLDKALDLARRTSTIATHFQDRDLQALALHDIGRILVSKGELAEGMALIDEAMAAAVSGELGPDATGRIYCNMIDTCEKLADYQRAAEWSEAARRWCELHAESGFPGLCRVHRAEIMRLRGSWRDAETEALRAATELQGFYHSVAGEAFYEIGEIRLRMGDHARAEEVFRQANCAVLTVGPQTRKQAPHEVDLNNILFATDFGAGAARAAQYAFSLAQEHGARVTVLHVVEETKAHTREGEERLRKLNTARMKQLMPAESENWCKVEFRVAFGAAFEEILGEARETNADLIIMGAKTSKAFPGHAPLTIAYNVVAKAKCPVLTVRG